MSFSSRFDFFTGSEANILRGAMLNIVESLHRDARTRFRNAVEEALAEVNDLAGIGDAQRQLLRRKVRRSVGRSRAKRRYYTALWMPFIQLTLFSLMGGLVVATSAFLGMWNYASRASEVLGGLLVGMILFVATVLGLRAVNGRGRRNRILKRVLFLSFVAYPVFSGTYSVVSESWVAYTAGAAIAPISFFTLALLFELAVRKFARRRVLPDTVYNRTAMTMLEVAALISRSREEWQSSAVSRRVVAALEDLAMVCQEALALRSRIGRWHADVFSQTAVEALRIAHVVREHKKLIACASGPGDFDAVVISLTNGVTALLVNDRNKLLENAPEAVLKDRVKQLVRHVMPVILLIVAAIVLPLVPPISDQGKVADSIRLTFIVAAVLALVAPRSESATRILDVLGKATSPK
ncbi:hypothetical protein [Streptomyces sp. NPDC056308]|uniref:hypothetical protein n=1 Tax=Streptomyces sp. NPDC056308 TaxID=3345780 RepID=UPI0035E2630C